MATHDLYRNRLGYLVHFWYSATNSQPCNKVNFMLGSRFASRTQEPTTSLDIKYVANNEFAQFQIWDFPGDYDTSSGEDFS